MAVLFKGIVQITGEHDTGKTSWALGAGTSPKDICFIDDDIKGRNTVEEVGIGNFGLYIDLIRESKGMLETKLYTHCMDIITKRLPEFIKTKRNGVKFEVLIWDTWARFENTIFPTVQKNPTKYREMYSAKGDIKGAQQWQASFDLEGEIMAGLEDVSDLVILVSHLKADSLNGVKTGRLVPDAKRPLSQKCFFRVYLRHNPKSSEPIGIILKRPSRKRIVEGVGIETINILPRKMQPFSWERIKYFWENPVGNVSFLPDEQPDEYDMACLENILTQQQMQVFMESVSLVKMGITEETPLGEPDEKYFSEEDVERVKKMVRAENMKIPEVSRITGFSIPDIGKMLSR